MTQVFQYRANFIARASIVLLLGLIVFGLMIVLTFKRTSYYTGVHVVVNQPVPFSHAHHVAGLGIDCRYCHTSVEQTECAGMPSTDTCMNCHWQIWTEADLLAPVRLSWQTGESIPWQRVNNLPDFVYFNHAIHIDAGVGCETCHGPIDEMPLVYQAGPFYMQWCLECHREPERFLRPREEIYNFDYEPPEDQLALGRRLVERYHIEVEGLTDCTICHR